MSPGMKAATSCRIAGVEVGKVEDISINPDATVRVEFSADDSVVLTEGTRAVIRYDNVIGGRYLALEEGAGGLKTTAARPDDSAGPDRPALDLDSVDRRLQAAVPRAGSRAGQRVERPTDQALQGQGATIASFLDQAAVLTNTLADRDQLIGEVVDNLNVVLGSLGGQSDRLDKAVTSLSELVHRLAERRTDIVECVGLHQRGRGIDRRPAGAVARNRSRRWSTRPTGSPRSP